jgi:tRNA modification GTPase
MKQADLVLYLFDVNEITADELQKTESELKAQQIQYLLIGNKIDLINEKEIRKKFCMIAGVIFISAKTNLHLEVLKERMMDMVLQDKLQTESVIVTNSRHFHALKKLSESLNDIYEGIENKIPGDLLALDIRISLQYLGEITGEITNEDQLDYIFSKFCIGK